MADQQPNFFDTFTGTEADQMQAVMAKLDAVPWAQAILFMVFNKTAAWPARTWPVSSSSGLGMSYTTPA